MNDTVDKGEVIGTSLTGPMDLFQTLVESMAKPARNYIVSYFHSDPRDSLLWTSSGLGLISLNDNGPSE